MSITEKIVSLQDVVANTKQECTNVIKNTSPNAACYWQSLVYLSQNQFNNSNGYCGAIIWENAIGNQKNVKHIVQLKKSGYEFQIKKKGTYRIHCQAETQSAQSYYHANSPNNGYRQNTQGWHDDSKNISQVLWGDKQQSSSRFRVAIMINNKPISQRRYDRKSYDSTVGPEIGAMVEHRQHLDLNDTITINLFDIKVHNAMMFTLSIQYT